jgi:hypothetical protein
MRAPRLAIASSMAAALCVVSAPSAADTTKDQCVDANAKAQDLRRDGKLAAARAQLRVCADASCPTIVRDDCTRRLDDLENAQPSLLFDVKDSAGIDLIDVRVSMDGRPLVDHLDGRPLSVDPGAHVFTFEVAGRPPVTDKFLVKEGEAGRRENVVISNPLPTPSGFGSQKVVGLSLLGAGLVGLGVGSAFGLMASSAWRSAKDACGGDVHQCADTKTAASQRDTTITDGLISTVGFIAGGALVAIGAVVFFTAGSHEESPTARFVVAPKVGPRQAGIVIEGAFQ